MKTSSRSAATGAPPAAARRSAQIEAGNIAELRAHLAGRNVSLMRRAEIGDAAIEVWLYPPIRQYYVSVSLQGTLRRTLKPVNEAEAWLNFDSFRRLAALGEVGRPVLLGQMNPGGAAAPSVPMNPAVPMSPTLVVPAVTPGADLRTVTVPPERLAAQQEVDAMDLALVQQAREQFARVEPSPPASRSATGTSTALSARITAASSSAQNATVAGVSMAATTSSSVPRVAGQAVETLRRQLIGDELARLVWNADSGQYTALLTRQGRVVGMQRGIDRAEAMSAYEDLVRQAEARAAAMPEATAAKPSP